MQQQVPSRTAYRVALRRAAHQVFDKPVVFHDPYALPILGLNPGNLAQSDLRAPKRASSESLRAFLVARALFAEESLARLIETHAVTQYVLLGAGLDTFALRNPVSNVRVFEVDHPATQAWKLDLLRQHDLPLPPTATFVPSDFEAAGLGQSLRAAGCNPTKPTLFAMFGVVVYLTGEAFQQTLAMIAQFTGTKALALDYGLPRASLPLPEQLAFDSLADRVARSGEPFRLFLSPEQMGSRLQSAGLHTVEDIAPPQMNERYFESRGSGLCVLGSGARFALAVG